MSPDANGDIKLVPMLEIEGRMNKYLPPAADLEKYGIFTKPTGNGGTYAYVPLQLVTDDRTGARVAFAGKMVYQPQFKPGTVHKVRLTWVVQAWWTCARRRQVRVVTATSRMGSIHTTRCKSFKPIMTISHSPASTSAKIAALTTPSL